MQSDNTLTAQDLIDHWPLVDKADRAELDAFVEHGVFAAAHHSSITNGNIMDAVWVRKWKQTGDQWIVKSRLCGRGFLDSQKSMIQRHSSTASRLSQRLAASIGVQERFNMESWDVSNAFRNVFKQL